MMQASSRYVGGDVAGNTGAGTGGHKNYGGTNKNCDCNRLLCIKEIPPTEASVSVIIVAVMTLICLASLIPDSNMSNILLILGPYVGLAMILIMFRYFLIERTNRTLEDFDTNYTASATNGAPADFDKSSPASVPAGTQPSTGEVRDADALCSHKNMLSSAVFVIMFVCVFICTGCMYTVTTNSGYVMAFFGFIMWAVGTIVWSIAHGNIRTAYGPS